MIMVVGLTLLFIMIPSFVVIAVLARSSRRSLEKMREETWEVARLKKQSEERLDRALKAEKLIVLLHSEDRVSLRVGYGDIHGEPIWITIRGKINSGFETYAKEQIEVLNKAFLEKSCGVLKWPDSGETLRLDFSKISYLNTDIVFDKKYSHIEDIYKSKELGKL